jgi:Nucleotidyl transferase AbiEii toxin, Type IV TA system
VPLPTLRALQAVVNRYAEHHGVAPGRVQRWIAFMALGAALGRVRDESGGPRFVIKGGVSLELRLRLRARATKDFDAAFVGERDAVLRALDEAFAEPYEGFTFRVGGEPAALRHMHRFDVKVEYQGKVWSSVRMEVSAYEGTPLPAENVEAISLAAFGLRGPETLPCLPLVKQVAQKIHAMTEVPEGGRANERFRDLADLWVLRGIVRPSAQLRGVCEETFRIRGTHAWPPDVVIHAHWREPFTALARDLDLAVGDVDAAAHDVREYVTSIAAV